LVCTQRKKRKGQRKKRRSKLMSKLAGRCGIYCGACMIHRIFKDKDLESAKIVAERFNCPPDLVKCNGCQNPGLEDWSFGNNPDGSERCEIQKCLDSKGYDFCYQCPILTECDLLRELNGRYEGVPYHNLKRLKEIGKEAWLEVQESMWHARNRFLRRKLQEMRC